MQLPVRADPDSSSPPPLPSNSELSLFWNCNSHYDYAILIEFSQVQQANNNKTCQAITLIAPSGSGEIGSVRLTEENNSKGDLQNRFHQFHHMQQMVQKQTNICIQS